MKIDFNKRYTTYAIYATAVIAAVILFIFLGIYMGSVIDGFLFLIDVVSPLIYGAAMAYIMLPVMRIFENKLLFKIKRSMLRRGIAVFFTYAVFISVLSVMVYAISPQIIKSFNDLRNNLSVYSASFQKWVDSVSEGSGPLSSVINKLTEYFDLSALSQPIEQLIQNAYGLIVEFSPYIRTFLGSFFIQLKNIIIGLIFAGYVLCSKELLLAQLNKLLFVLFSPVRVKKIKDLIKFTDKTFGQFIIGDILDAIIVGILTAISLTVLRMPYIPLISVIIAVTNIIPFFGPFIGAIPSFIFIFISNPIKAFIFALLILGIQQVDGNIIKPKILGQTIGIPAIVVLISITIMGGLFGIVGMLLGVPVFAVLGKVIGDLTEQKRRRKEERRNASSDDGESSDDGDFGDDTGDGSSEGAPAPGTAAAGAENRRENARADTENVGTNARADANATTGGADNSAGTVEPGKTGKVTADAEVAAE